MSDEWRVKGKKGKRQKAKGWWVMGDEWWVEGKKGKRRKAKGERGKKPKAEFQLFKKVLHIAQNII